MFLRRRRGRCVALLTSALTTKDYFGLLVHSLARRLARLENPLFLVPLPPATDYEQYPVVVAGAEQDRQQDWLRMICGHPDFVAAIIIPISHKDLGPTILSCIQTRHRPRLIVYDRPFPTAWTRQFSDAGYNPAAVFVDSIKGGRQAAAMLYAGLKTLRPNKHTYSVVIIIGTHAEDRQNGFRQRWKGIVGDTGAVEDSVKRIAFDRDKAKEYCEEYYGGDRALPDGFFCCNDEMALGVRNYLVAQFGAASDNEAVPLVVGFDGIPEMKELIKKPDPIVVGTADVDIQETVTRALCDLLEKTAEGEESGQEVPIPPSAFMQGRVEQAYHELP